MNQKDKTEYTTNKPLRKICNEVFRCIAQHLKETKNGLIKPAKNIKL